MGGLRRDLWTGEVEDGHGDAGNPSYHFFGATAAPAGTRSACTTW